MKYLRKGKKKRNRLSGAQKRKRNSLRGAEWHEEILAREAEREKAERVEAWETGWAAGKAFAAGEAEMDGSYLGEKLRIALDKDDREQTRIQHFKQWIKKMLPSRPISISRMFQVFGSPLTGEEDE